MGIFQQEYWSGFLCPPPRDLSNPGIEHRSPALQADSLPSELPGRLLSLIKKLLSELFSRTLVSRAQEGGIHSVQRAIAFDRKTSWLVEQKQHKLANIQKNIYKTSITFLHTNIGKKKQEHEDKRKWRVLNGRIKKK